MTNDNVIPFTGVTVLDIPADTILESLKGKAKDIVIVGWDNNGDEIFISSSADGGDVLWHLERAKLKLLRKGDV